MTRPLIEICVEGVDGAIAAAAAGADRIELCASLLEGGISPSLGTVQATLRSVTVPVFVMIRPRGGDFLYSDAEFASMCDDAAALRNTGAAGVVFGCLTEAGEIDAARTRALVAAARPLGVTFHRAFDMTADLPTALEALIACGVDRVLTSGGAPTGTAGLQMLTRLSRQAQGRIIVMGCGALRPDSIAIVRQAAELTELHFSAQAHRPSPMQHRNSAIAMGGADIAHEYRRLITDADIVRATIAAVQA